MPSRFVDGLYLFRKPKKKRKRYYLWLLILPLIFSIFFVGRLSASYILPNLNLISLFREGKFLVLFQNNSELRSSGGFIGSYAVVETRNFKVKNISFNTNIYALDNTFDDNNYVEPPAQIKKMTKGQTWALRDANYDASFDEAAKDIIYFYETETGDSIDGIIALNAEVIVDLLKITGPIFLPKYNLTISADNFYRETQMQIEKTYYENPENWVINEPKSFLRDLYPILLERAMQNKIELAKLVKNEFATKEILLYFKNAAKQSLVQKHNLAGKMPSEQELKDIFSSNDNIDYLYINSNSYSGNKSSLSVKQDIDYELSETDVDGRRMLVANLKITRVHGGSYDWPDGKNTTWMRIFTPRASEFKSAALNGQDVRAQMELGGEGDKNYFGLEAVVEPGQASVLEIFYLLPYTRDYHLLVQKQPGEIGDGLRVTHGGRLLFDGMLDRDKKI